MSKGFSRLLCGAALALATALPLSAQDAPGPDTVIATVNGEEITLGHMILARARLPQQYQQLPDDVLFTGILDQLVQQAALAQTLEGALPGRARLALENEERSLRAGEVLDGIAEGALSDEAVEAAYKERFSEAANETEYNASHILVETEEDAQAIVEELAGGADFAQLAQERSTGPSGPSGGSLGWFGTGTMVKPFEDAATALEPGQTSGPVQTQFGWHVIRMNDTRIKEAPPLEEVRAEIEAQLQNEAIQARIEELVAAAEVDRSAAEGVDPSLLSDLGLLE